MILVWLATIAYAALYTRPAHELHVAAPDSLGESQWHMNKANSNSQRTDFKHWRWLRLGHFINNRQ
jgi:hypothetical protein